MAEIALVGNGNIIIIIIIIVVVNDTIASGDADIRYTIIHYY
jgi:hypothetical protein